MFRNLFSGFVPIAIVTTAIFSNATYSTAAFVSHD
jgi:hypothetical protein